MAEGMLQGKVAVITGAGRGIGRAIAIMMASRGASVVVNDVGAGLSDQSTDLTPAQEVVDTIKKAGGQAVAAYDSVSDWDGAHRIVKAALDNFGRIDILVNNAGILRDKMFHHMTQDDIDSVMKVHLYGCFNMSRATVEHFRKQEGGSFIHMTSTSGIYGNLGQANYAAAKLALVGFSNSLQLEMERFNVRSNLIAPSANTRMTQSVPSGKRGGAEAQAARLASMPPEGVAALATLLASDAAAGIKGQIIAARGSEIILYNHPRPVRILQRDGGWTPESLAEAMPAMATQYSAIGSAPQGIRWLPQ